MLTKSNGWRVKLQNGKFKNSNKIDEVITEEAIQGNRHIRQVRVDVSAASCTAAALQRCSTAWTTGLCRRMLGT